MSTTSTNFNLIIATTSDTVDVVSHVAGNFTTIDSLLSQAHTGTGELKSGVGLTNANLTNPILTGTLTGGSIVSTTGNFQTLTATGGALTADTLAVGTYSIPSTIGSTNQILTVVTGNAVWAANSPGTGAATNLGNLASVSINTSLQNFTASQVTVAQVIATSAQLTNISSFAATTGTFSSNVTISGTATIDVIDATGGDLTVGTFSIGTYSYPATIGNSGQILFASGGNACAFQDAPATTSKSTVYCARSIAANTTGYASLGGINSVTANGISVPIPASGTMKNLYIHTINNDGTGLQVKLVKNNVVQSLAATIGNGATAAVDTSNTVAVTTADRIAFFIDNSRESTLTINIGCELDIP